MISNIFPSSSNNDNFISIGIFTSIFILKSSIVLFIFFELNIFIFSLHFGHINPSILDTRPIILIFVLFKNDRDFLTLNNDTSCGIVTTIAPFISLIVCIILSTSSPVPGGKSMIK